MNIEGAEGDQLREVTSASEKSKSEYALLSFDIPGT
jgi:hypothetical protein